MSKTLFVQIIVGVLMVSLFLIVWGVMLAGLQWLLWPFLLTLWWFFTNPALCLFFGVVGVLAAIAVGLIGGGVYAAFKKMRDDAYDRI